MRKLITSIKTAVLCLLLFGFVFPVFSQSSVSTYTLSVKPIESIYGQQLNESNCDFKWGDIKKVTENGDIQVAIKFKKGLDNGQLGQKKSDNQYYYNVNYKTPYYQAVVKDKTGKVILDKYYGAVSKTTHFGKGIGLNADELGAKWRRGRDAFYSQKEQEGINFIDFSKDLQQVLKTNTALIVAPAPPKAVVVNTYSEPVITEDLYRYRPNNENNIVAMAKRNASTAEAEKKTVKKKKKPNKKSKKKSKKKKSKKSKSKKSKSNKKADEVETRGEESLDNNTTEKPALKKSKKKKEKTPKAKKSKKKKTKKEEGVLVQEEQIEKPVIGMESSVEEAEPTKVAEKKQKNIVKLGLLGLTIRNPSIAYERILSYRTSVNIHASYLTYSKPLSFFSDDTAIDINDVQSKLTGFSITPEYRIYAKKRGAPRGFYFAPYLRYAKYQLKLQDDIDVEGNDGTTETVAAEIKGDWTAIGAGLQLGVQWVIKNRVTIDWSFLGLGVNRTTIGVLVRTDYEDVDYEATAADIEQDIADENIPVIGDKLKVEAGEDFIKGELPVFLPALRSSLTVGFWF